MLDLKQRSEAMLLKQIHDDIFSAHQRAFGERNYEYVDPQTTLDLLVAEILALRHELAAKDEA